mmetsp:Transcript_20990/g.44046  ORF Transcript_20990/g.44046 Transcript_20990/m.44046 type:complete len:93 (+) Transcript_20990:1308-1586(+)
MTGDRVSTRWSASFCKERTDKQKNNKQTTTTTNKRTDNAIADKHSKASYWSVAILSCRITNAQNLFISINGERTNILTTVILVGACYFIIGL